MKRSLQRLLVGIGLFSASCQRPDDEDFRGTNNVIAVLPLTGPFASKGEEHKLAIQMALRDLESTGPIRGRLFQVFLVDAGATATECESRLRDQIARLTDGGRLHLVGLLSSTTAAFKCALKGAAGRGIPHVEVSSGSALDEVFGEKAAEAAGTAFSTRPLCMPEPLLTARFVTARQSTWQRIAFMRGSEPHDLMHTRMLRAELTLQGYTGSVVGEPSGDDIVMEQKPYDPYLQRIMMMTPRPDVIYYHLNGDLNNQDFLKAAQRVGYSGRVVTCGMARADVLLDNVKQGGLSSYLAGAAVGGIASDDGRLFFMMRGPVPSPALTRFSRDFQAFSGLKAEPFTSAAYDGAMLLGLGLAASANDSLGAIAASVQAVSSGGTKVYYGDPRRARELAESRIDVDYDGTSGDVDQALDAKLGFVVRGRFFVERIASAGAGFEYRLADGAPDEQLAPRPASH